jgi:very-short-patch-repair endonuclease
MAGHAGALDGREHRQSMLASLSPLGAPSESRLAVLSQHVFHRSRRQPPQERHAKHGIGVDLLRALDEVGGAAHYSVLRRRGVSEHAIRRAVASDQVLAVGHGTFALPWAPRESTLATLFRARIDCLTACEHWGLPLWGEHMGAHLVVPRHRSASRRDPSELAQVVIHRTSSPLPSGMWVPVAEAIDQAAWCTTPLEQLVLIDAALHRGLLLPHDVGHFGAGTARRRAWMRRMASGVAESPLETVARAGLVAAGLAVREQVVVRGVGRVDFVVEETVAVEVDGWEFHQSREAFERDRARDRASLLQGRPVVRFTARELRADLAGVVRQVAEFAGREPRKDFDRRLAWVVGRDA